MGLRVYLQLLFWITVWLLYLAFNMIFILIRTIYWMFTGVFWQEMQSSKPENYDKCVHLQNIIFKHRFDEFTECRISDYVLVHDCFVHPRYLLSDDVTLLCITDKIAVFVEKTKSSPHAPRFTDFFVLGQYNNANKILTMPLNQFHKLAEEIGDPDARLLFLQNQARCGGTLVTNIFKNTDRCVTFNEPHAFNSVCKYIYNKTIWDKATDRQMFRDVVRVLCKPYHGFDEKVLCYIIKPTFSSMISADLTQEVFPDCTQIFVYREPNKVAVSVRRISEVILSLKILMYLPNIPQLCWYLVPLLGYVKDGFKDFTPGVHQELEFGYQMATVTMAYYFRFREQGIKMIGLKYEDLLANRDKIVKEMLEACKLPLDLLPKAVQALDRDSQKDSPINREAVTRAIPNPPKPTEPILEAVRKAAKKYKVPGPDGWTKDFRLEGSFEP